jgi:RNA polymerase sigma factor for flagellar operon FliA
MADLNELWARWNDGGRQKSDWDALIGASQSFCRATAVGVANSMSSGLDVDDLTSIAVIRMMRPQGLVERFDPGRGVKFTTFATHGVRGAIMDYLRSNHDHMPSATRRLVTQLHHADARLTAKLARPPTDAEVAADMRVTEKKVASLRRLEVSSVAAAEQLDEGHAVEDGVSAGTMLDYDLLRKRLVTALDLLDGPEKVVMTLYYVEELSIPEIAGVLGVAPSMAYKVRDKAIGKVLSYMRT